MSRAIAFKLTTFTAILFSFTSFMTFYPYADATHQSKGDDPREQFVNKVNLTGESFIVEWTVDHDSQSVEFKLNVAVDEKGWVLFGFMPVSKNSDKAAHEHKIQGTKGDFVITWVSSSGKRKIVDLNTIETGNLQPDGNSTHLDYHVTVDNSAENSSTQLLHVTRKLHTGDPQDVPIMDQPLWIVGAFGNSQVYLTDLSNITTGNIEDDLMFQKVIILRENDNNTNNSNEPWHKVLQEQVRKHWIGVVIGAAGLLTVVIVAVIYLCSRSGKEKVKKVKMTFYKDDDDEAKVAFLHSRT